MAYQEILLHPIRPAAEGREVLAAITLRVTYQEDGLRFSDPVTPPHHWDPASPFINPADARVSPRSIPVSPRATQAGPLPGLRVGVVQDGLYRMDAAWLAARGFNPGTADPRNFHLTCQGVEIPILVEGESDGAFDPGDAVVFYGQKAELAPRATWNGGDFTDTNLYWLRTGATPGLRMADAPAAPASGFPAVTQFQSVTSAEQDTFFDVVDHFRPNGEHWFWSPVVGVVAGGAPGTRSLTFQAPRATAGLCEVRLTQASLNTGTHALRAQLNGAYPSAGADPWTWSGKAIAEAVWTFGTPLVGANTLLLTLPGFADHDDYQIPDRLEVTYWRTLQADSGTLLLTPPNADATYTSSGYSAAPTVLDLSATDAGTGLALPRRLTGVSFSAGSVSFQMAYDAGVTGRKVLLCQTPSAPASAEVASPEDLTGLSPGAELLVITHPDFAPSEPLSAWQRWLTRRSAGRTVRVVRVQDIFDNFSGGLFDPPALRQFFEVVTSSWEVVPTEVLLVGDGTWDYKNHLLKSGFQNTVPTMAFEDLADSTYLGRYVSDAWFADGDGDGYPDAAVGRITARSPAEAEGVFAKILAYEDQGLSGTWYQSALYVADEADYQGLEFESHHNALAAAWTGAPWTTAKLYYGQPPYGGTDYTAFNLALRGTLPASALANYSGHGSFSWWGWDGGVYSLFTAQKVRDGNTASDVDKLAATWHLPFVLQGTCYTSAFAEPNTPALGEELLARADGGSIGSGGQTTIGYVNEEQAFADAFYGGAFGRSKSRRLGELMEAGRFSLPSSNTRAVRGIVLLGDPCLALRLPAPEAPLTLSAVGQNTAAALTWGSAPASAGYLVYRSSNGGISWTRLTATALPSSQTSYLAEGLTNTVAYLFYVTSVDSGGFEGPPSPLASATPLNPNPPAVPSGLQAVDAGTGDALDVHWSANSEPDLSGYTLWWGTASGSYPNSRALGASATATRLEGLTVGVTYYITLTATNTSGNTSAGALEVSGSPTSLRLAIHPPAMISDLRVAKVGNDLVLDWSKPLVDLGGSPVTVSQFHLYRVVNAWDWNLDTVSTVSPNAKVAIPATSATSYTYTDTGAASIPGSLSYLVVALTAAGDRSPASTMAPAPVLSLRVTRSGTTGKTLLAWSPVTSTADGRAGSLIDHYRVYGFYPMTSSADHVRPASPVLTGDVPAALTPCEGSAAYCDASTAPPLFYTVVAVDRRGNTSLY